ncbi:MAG: hypothetical protein HQK52_16735 [Oligoflexia bacterium]|nr:hypothetical protein [Oligoflexia bacterium]
MLKRILIYLQEMYPPAHALAPIIMSIVFFMAMTKLNGYTLIAGMSYWPLVLATISQLFFVLLIRVMDEFKDYQDDLKNFPNRPLPSGRVLHGDLKLLGVCIVIIMILLNAWSSLLAVGMLLVLVYSLLMLKWFFIEERMRKSLPLALLSHHPIIYCYLLYLSLGFVEFSRINLQQGILPQEARFIPFLMAIPLAFLSTNWELSRKIKPPQLETSYTTYSKILGPKIAVISALLTQLITFSGVSYYLYLTNSLAVTIALFITLALLTMLPYLRFLCTLKTLSPTHETLRVYSEIQAIFVQLFIALEFLITLYK